MTVIRFVAKSRPRLKLTRLTGETRTSQRVRRKGTIFQENRDLLDRALQYRVEGYSLLLNLHPHRGAAGPPLCLGLSLSSQIVSFQVKTTGFAPLCVRCH